LKEQIQLLIELQEIDSKIDVHEKDVARLPQAVQELARNLVVLRREVAEIKSKLEQIRADLSKKEQALAIEQEKIRKSERRLLSIKNQKELNALNREIKLGKKVVGEIEDSILTFMTEIESLTKSSERKEAEYAGLETEHLSKKTEADQVIKSGEQELKELKSSRQDLISGIDRDILKRYEIVKRGRGNAVAPLESGICSGCHMSIPPQLNIRVLKQEELIACPNCQRLLYARPEDIPQQNNLEASGGSR
jgi:predicted  nucleic acid-binding Zn-ribbon protein